MKPDHYVLVLDDNLAMCQAAQKVWDRHNVELVSTLTIEDAVDLLKTRKFSLVAVSADYLKDETINVVKFLRTVANEPIIVISAADDARLKVEVLENGADVFLSVPDALEEGVATGWALIRRYTDLNQRQGTEEAIYRKKLVLYPESRRVFVADKEVILTRLEFDILQLLMEGDGRVFSYDDIFRSIWGDPYAGTDKPVLWSHIRKIRKKLAVDEEVAEYIKNVHSVGYKFMAD